MPCRLPLATPRYVLVDIFMLLVTPFTPLRYFSYGRHATPCRRRHACHAAACRHYFFAMIRHRRSLSPIRHADAAAMPRRHVMPLIDIDAATLLFIYYFRFDVIFRRC